MERVALGDAADPPIASDRVDALQIAIEDLVAVQLGSLVREISAIFHAIGAGSGAARFEVVAYASNGGPFTSGREKSGREGERSDPERQRSAHGAPPPVAEPPVPAVPPPPVDGAPPDPEVPPGPPSPPLPPVPPP